MISRSLLAGPTNTEEITSAARLADELREGDHKRRMWCGSR
jgi:hypothetical protein